MALPIEVGSWHGIGPTENSGANYQNTNVNYVFAKTNTVFAKTNTPQIPNVATIAVGNTPSDAHAHRKEMESMRRDGSGHPDDLARALARENHKECLSQNGLSQKLPKHSWYHVEPTVVWLIYGEIWDDPTNGKPRC